MELNPTPQPADNAVVEALLEVLIDEYGIETASRRLRQAFGLLIGQDDGPDGFAP